MGDRVLMTIKVKVRATKAELQREIADRVARGEWPSNEAQPSKPEEPEVTP
jgi:hypothetical protein